MGEKQSKTAFLYDRFHLFAINLLPDIRILLRFWLLFPAMSPMGHELMLDLY
jgi:hypothetical protein